MKIYGLSPIPYPSFQKIYQVEDIANIPANTIPYFKDTRDCDLLIGGFAYSNQVSYAFIPNSIKSFLIYSNLGAKYALLENDPTPYQNLAKEYLLDIEILKIIQNPSEIERYALLGIDGVVFESIL